MLKPNEAMIEDAASAGARIGLLATFAASLATMPAEFAMLPKPPHLQPMLIEGALAALDAGDGATHDRLAAETAQYLDGCDAIALAQFSLARAAPCHRRRHRAARADNPGQRRAEIAAAAAGIKQKPELTRLRDLH